MDTRIFRQADFIESSVDNVGSSLIEGALFAVLILFVFLASIRTTLISIVAIPLSLLGSCVVLYLLGMNINTMTLGGMCIAIGSLVDDAIIDVENVYKRLRENHALPVACVRHRHKVILLYGWSSTGARISLRHVRSCRKRWWLSASRCPKD